MIEQLSFFPDDVVDGKIPIEDWNRTLFAYRRTYRDWHERFGPVFYRMNVNCRQSPLDERVLDCRHDFVVNKYDLVVNKRDVLAFIDRERGFPGYVVEIYASVTEEKVIPCSEKAEERYHVLKDMLQIFWVFKREGLEGAVEKYLKSLSDVWTWAMIGKSRLTMMESGIDPDDIYECPKCRYMSEFPVVPCPGCQEYEIQQEDFMRRL